MRVILASTVLLALPSMINAVALSAMAPYAKNLPPACQSLYTAQISGCDANDFKTGQCSSSCQSALQALVQPILKACGGQGVSGQNLIVAYLAGLGPQQLCRNLGSPGTTSEESTTSTTQQWTTPQQTTTSTPKATIVSSTSTAESAKETTSLIADTSSPSAVAKTTSTKQKTTTKSTSSSSATKTSSSRNAAQTTSKSSSTSSTSTTTSAGNSQTNLSDGSGGGSPFDTAGNLMNAAAGFSASGVTAGLPALAAALFFALR